MAENKKAFTRYRVIDRCLRNTTRYYSAKHLLEEIEIALRYEGYEGGIKKTKLHEDLDYMKEYLSAPIERKKLPTDKRVPVYYYSDPNFSILNQPFNEDEKSKIREGLMVLSQIRGLEQIEWISEILPSIEEKLNFKVASREIISYDFNVDYSGLGHINSLFNAINQKRVLKIRYHSFKEAHPVDFVFHPYHLRQYNSRWYVYGLNESEQRNHHNLALDRIVELQETNLAYKEDETNWSDFFSDFVGVTKTDKSPVDVKLLFSAEQAPYIRTKPLHGTQKEKMNEDSTMEVTINVIPNFELESLILSFGERVKVLEPESLRGTIAKRINESRENYYT